MSYLLKAEMKYEQLVIIRKLLNVARTTKYTSCNRILKRLKPHANFDEVFSCDEGADVFF